MNRRDRLVALFAALLVLAGAKIGQQIYRWYAFAPERAAIARLEGELENAALGVVATQISADTLQHSLESLDLELRDARGKLDLVERGAQVGQVDGAGATLYFRELESYNDQVVRRNELFQHWRETLENNHRYVDRYNLMADSIRTLAEAMGEPYYPIRTPAEIAVVRGWGKNGG